MLSHEKPVDKLYATVYGLVIIMVFNLLLYTSLAIFILGSIYKISRWFSRSIGVLTDNITTGHRIVSAVNGILSVIFSKKILILLRVFIFDVILQMRILRESFMRWLMHMLIYTGFMLLLLMHALGTLISENIFTDYYSTINPFFFLRNFFGAMVIIGLGIAVFRRLMLKIPHLKTNAMDRYALIILFAVILSGVFLEGVKITSYTSFEIMLADYADIDDEEEIEALESYWVNYFGVVSPNVAPPFDEEILEAGKDLDESYCADCHSPIESAFIGYATSVMIHPIALLLDRVDSATFLYYLHIIASFLGLAYLPFSKMFHMIASPISLLAGAVMEKATSDPANMATRQAMELDACMHCGTCSRHCSVAVAFNMIGNINILPSEKLHLLKRRAGQKELKKEELEAILEGIYLCTNCDRCTVVCPAGIQLRDMWLNVREKLIQQGTPVPLALSPFSFYRGLNRKFLPDEAYPKPIKTAREAIAKNRHLLNRPEKTISLTPIDRAFKAVADHSTQAGTYSSCFSCENCSTVCPVVENYKNPQEVLGLLPHQIMRSVGLGLKDLALGSDMLWDCLTCYQCQEHCPQGVKVTEVLYELKNQAISEVNSKRDGS